MKKLEKNAASPKSAGTKRNPKTDRVKSQAAKPAASAKKGGGANPGQKVDQAKEIGTQIDTPSVLEKVAKKKGETKQKHFKVPKAKQIRMRRTFKKTSAEIAKEGDLYKRCRKLRRAMGMTQGEFGDALGTYQTMISLVERRKITLNVRLLRLFERLESAYLNGELEELAPGEEYDSAAAGEEFYREAYEKNDEDQKKKKKNGARKDDRKDDGE